MGKTLPSLIVILVILGVGAIYLNSEGHPNLSFQPPFRQFDIVEPVGEKPVPLKFAPDGWNQEELVEKTIATLPLDESGTIKQGGDIESPCIYFNLSWWCRIETASGKVGWTRASNLSSSRP